MPRYDLAGNPLPETGTAAPPPAGGPMPPALPPYQNAQGRPIHLAPPPSPAPTADAPIRYDLAGNPLPAAPAPAAPAGMSMPAYAPLAHAQPTYAQPTYTPGAGTWPPPPVASPGYGRPAFQNNSGRQAECPPEIARLRWNWGAFFFPILWCKKHGMTTVAATLGGTLLVLRWARRLSFLFNPALYLLLWVVYGVGYFVISVYFGCTGHSYGWRNRQFEGIDDYLSCQRKWMWWGFGINGLLMVVLPVLLILGVVGAATVTGGSQQPSAGYATPGNSGPNDGGDGSSGDGGGQPTGAEGQPGAGAGQ